MLGGWREEKGTRPFVLFRLIKKRSFNLLCVLDLFFQNAGSQLCLDYLSGPFTLQPGPGHRSARLGLGACCISAEHLLRHCPLHDGRRRATWPEITPLKEKLYGDLAELKTKAAFVTTTGVDV